MKKFLTALFISSLLALPLQAVSWSVGGSFGAASTSLETYVLEGGMHLSVDTCSLAINVAEDEFLDASFYWNYEGASSLRATLGTAIHERWHSGGLWTLTGDVGQSFLFQSGWNLGYRFGVQMGLSWSEWATDYCPLSLSPYIKLRAGYENEHIALGVYMTGEHMYEKTAQSLPIVGLDLSWHMDASNTLTLDMWYKVADYMAQPNRIISDTELRLYYTYRSR